ncbi:MAG: LacI family DNA-binding transcriptional regulator, partial [bacterium]
MNIDFKKLPSSQITQRDIANHLGIRQATVSRALSGHPDISEKTKRLILKTAETIGYKIENNDAARRLIARRHGNAPQNNVIALLIPGTLVQSPYYAKIIDGILSSLVPYGYILAISNQVTNKAAEINLLKIINRGLVDGVILIPNKDSEFINVLMKNQFSGNPLITIIMKDETESSLN